MDKSEDLNTSTKKWVKRGAAKISEDCSNAKNEEKKAIQINKS